MQLAFTFIIPVYNRPNEIEELLQSFVALQTDVIFDIVIIEDGSSVTSKEVVEKYRELLKIDYYFKSNSGPGDSRNYGMERAKGNYFIILDSDCLLPPNYLNEVQKSLKESYVDCFGGPDAAHKSFSSLQKAINFSMTSILTTGGIRGGKKHVNTFQPRSFNMGLSKEAFLKTQGFGKIHPGEDPDLSIRLTKLGYKTKLIPTAFVYHKRRISWNKFFIQVKKFGLVRPILNKWHPETAKVTYWFPSIFCVGFLVAIGATFIGFPWLIYLYVIYFMLAFSLAIISTKSVSIAIMAILAIVIQFAGYGYGFLKSIFYIHLLGKKPEKQFPNLFFL
ncbi:glycosyltransferase [Corallibacter sp.]|uniref:glycosyltransferase n=1 Tax=Corallibacter sp. TaxID=2038084 RepID=UPI003A94BEC5